MTYNGWVNYPTWAVHLWISNEEFLWNWALDIVGQNERDKGDDAWRGPDILREWVLDEVVREAVGELEPSMATDILGWGMAQVDWLEAYDAIVEALPEVNHEAE